LVTDRDESLRAFEALQAAFTDGARHFPGHAVGWQGGSVNVDVHWHGSLGVWGVFEKHPVDDERARRFWICFGISDPSHESALKVTVEMNPPHEGEDRRTGGVFLRDELGGTYAGHSGRVGGGRSGIGLRAFKAHSRDLAWQEIETPKGPREVLVFGPLQEKEFCALLAQFVHTVADFKEAVTMSR
jgi:hypothetical protein